MKKVLQVVTRILGYLFAGFVVGLSTFLSYQMLNRVFPDNPQYPIMGVGLFDVAVLLWFALFVFDAEGLQQRALCMLMFGISLVATAVMALGEIIMSQVFVGVPTQLATIIVYALGVALLANVIAMYVYHLSNPGIQDSIEEQTRQDEAVDDAKKLALEYEMQLRPQVARLLAQQRVQGALARLGLLNDDSIVGASRGQLAFDPRSAVSDSMDAQPRVIITPEPRGMPDEILHSRPSADNGTSAPADIGTGKKPTGWQVNPTIPRHGE